MFWGWALSEEPRIRPWASSEPVSGSEVVKAPAWAAPTPAPSTSSTPATASRRGRSNARKGFSLMVFEIDDDQ